jgi:hypothetical protein
MIRKKMLDLNAPIEPVKKGATGIKLDDPVGKLYEAGELEIHQVDHELEFFNFCSDCGCLRVRREIRQSMYISSVRWPIQSAR